MGRSVETIGDNVLYFQSYEMEEPGDWEDVIECLQQVLTDKYTSFVAVTDKWAPYPYRENRIILENYHVQVSISEYCGCGAVSFFILGDNEYPELAEHWLAQNFDKIKELVSGYIPLLRRIGTFSNGVGVFENE